MTDPLVSTAEAMAIGARLDGAEIGFAWSLPFIGLLLSIAVFPLFAAYFWERHFGKVAALWTFALLLPCAVVFGLRMTAAQVLHTFLLDYLPFIILLFALFVVAGGIRGSAAISSAPFAFIAEVLFHVERRILSNFTMAAIHQRHRLWARYRGDLAFRGVGVVELLVLAVPINDGSHCALQDAGHD